MRFNFQTTFLPPSVYNLHHPTAVASPVFVYTNAKLASKLGLCANWLKSQETLDVFSGNALIADSQPIALAYAGHQFGHWNPQLGDGRALLLGEHVTPDGNRVDVQLKGSGQTPYSRGGDGRSPLGPVLRECLVSEAMAALGVPTTRTLAAVATGDMVWRNEALPGGILTRVASSHLRFGTLQYFAAKGDTETLQTLVMTALQRHYPSQVEHDNPVLTLLEHVVKSQANTIAHWQSIGFIHGVMNTDNMLLSGETIDYGPCAFMDTFDPNTVFSSIDHQGRYAYQNQPAIGHWNLAALADALIPLIDTNETQAAKLAQAVIDQFPSQFMQAYLNNMRGKLGLATTTADDAALIQSLLDLMSKHATDFTLTFRGLTEHISGFASVGTAYFETQQLSDKLTDWMISWRARLGNDHHNLQQSVELMQRNNPVLIPRNHVVEAAITAGYAGDYEPFHLLMDSLLRPFETDRHPAHLLQPPRPQEIVSQTFCGT